MKYLTHLITPSIKKKLKKIKKNLEYIYLEEENKITNGDNRVIYQHPNEKNKIIKVLTDKRNKRNKKVFRFIKKIYISDPNIREYLFLDKYVIGKETISQYFPEYFGFVKTNKGLGICYELVKNNDGNISKNLSKYISDNGMTDELIDKINQLINFIKKNKIQHHDINAANMLVK